MRVFTTGQAAEICKVSRRTLIKWFENGRLKGFKIPGSKERRIPEEHLYQFLKENSMPLDGLNPPKGKNRILFVTQDFGLRSQLETEFSGRSLFEILFEINAFNTGITTQEFRPACVVFDFSIGRTECMCACNALRRNQDYKDILLIALLLEWDSRVIDLFCMDEIFRKPVDVFLLFQRIETLLSSKKNVYL